MGDTYKSSFVFASHKKIDERIPTFLADREIKEADKFCM